jgi:(p)ppGpp synthase/HD superfamily hydrolase
MQIHTNAIIKFLQDSKAEFHTYQIKQDRAFRVVIRNLHHSTDINNIKNELEDLSFRTRNINNVIQKQTKQKLPFFFVDLEPATKQT